MLESRVDPPGPGYDTDLIPRALAAYSAVYEEQFPPGTDEYEANYPKNTKGTIEALQRYVKEYAADDFKVMVLDGQPAIEIAGMALLDFESDLKIVFRLDTLVEDAAGDGWILERKTAKAFPRQWIQQWENSMQASTYIHAAWAYLGRDRVAGLIADGVGFQKTATKFLRQYVRRSVPQMQLWLDNTRRWVGRLQQEHDRLADTSPSDQVMEAFPCNFEACTKFYGCPYISFCTGGANILRLVHNLKERGQEAPPTYTVERWDPTEHYVEPAKIKVEV